MSTEDHRDDIDPIDVVRTLAPADEPADELLARVRSDLMTHIDHTTARASNDGTDDHTIHLDRRRGGRRRWLVPIAAAAVLATTAAGWAMTRGTTSPTTTIACPGSRDGDVTFIHATTGDPVADCTEAWQSYSDGPAPTMVAFRLANGSISVVIDGHAAPDGATPLGSGDGIDPRVIALSEAMEGVSSDLRTGCLDEAAARAAIEAEIDRVGLDRWTIAVDDDRPIDAARPCARPFVQADQARVLVLGGADDTNQFDDPYVPFAHDLDAELAANCSNLAEAEAIVDRVAAATDVSSMTDAPFTVESGSIQLRTVDEPSEDCTRATVEIGGAIAITLRGPAA